MADTTNDEPKGGQPETDAPPAEQDALFRLQMAISDFLLGNARYFGWLVGIVLFVALVYGSVTSYLTSRSDSEFAAIAAVDYKMPKVDPLATFGLAPMDDPTDTTRMANVEEGARRYAALGASSHGSAAVYAWLKAADAYERVGKDDERNAALRSASDVGAKGLPGYTADAAYAASLRDAGKNDEALAVMRTMSGRYDGLLAERSLLLLADTQIQLGKKDDAKLVVAEFKQRFPQSPRGAEIAAIEARAQAGS